LLHGQPGPGLKALETWQRPRLSVSGGDLVAMGLEAGPVVAATLQAIERDWVAAGFPADGETVRAMARAHVDQALRSSQ
jgi:poly(A) polymerase